MVRALISALVALVSLPAMAQDLKPAAIWGAGPQKLLIATGSPGELGLLEVLATNFAKRENASVHWFKAGSGQAMGYLRDRKVDMILAHAPAAERKAVADGWATGRQLFGSNEFWIVGPADDPAKLGEARDAADAMKRIGLAKAKFVSRGDNSGTHQKEMELWKAAGLEPSGEWYIVTKDFMTASLKRADAERGYFITDSSTFVVERTNTPNLKVVFKGGQMLMNPYHTLWLSQPSEGTELARKLAAYLMSDEVQALLRTFGKDRYGEAMYNDAKVSRERWPEGQ